MQIELITKIKIRATIKLSDGTLIDPSYIDFTMEKPDGTLVKYLTNQLVRENIGIYSTEWSVDAVGIHRFKFQTSGNIVTAKSGAFEGIDSLANI